MKLFAASFAAGLALMGLPAGGYVAGRMDAPKPKPDLVTYNAISNVSMHATTAAAIYDVFGHYPQINSVVKLKDGSRIVYFTFAPTTDGPAALFKSTVTPAGVAEPAVCISCGDAVKATHYSP